MKITVDIAKSALGMVKMFGTPEAAAHQGRVSLTAIAPYTDRQLSRTVAVLDYLSAAEGERREHLMAQLQGFAA